MSKKRQLLIDTALDLFYQHGINVIGINEVLKVSGVAKRTLYNHFDSKEALVLAALEQRHHQFMSWLESVLHKSQSDLDVIENLFDGLDSWFQGKSEILGSFRGCFFINTAAEYSHPDSSIVNFCAFHKQEVARIIAAKLSGHSPHLLDAICIMKEGVITTAYMTHKGEQACHKCKVVLNALATR
ncbi:transcriptional regulator [Vibrio tubiashii]|nr:transcriptional regulator [Vibrio tubiashii]